MAKNLQLVVFSLGDELYGVSIDSVQEIVRLPSITGVPDAPDFLEGVINLRGRIVPVIDLRKRLRVKEAIRTKSTRVLITETSSKVGLLVDSASEVLKIQPDSIEAPPEIISAIGLEYITGVAKNNGRLVIILDINKILSVEDMKKIGNNAECLLETEAA